MKKSYMEFTDVCIQESENIMLLEKHISEGTKDEEELEQIAAAYAERKTYIRLYINDEILIDRLPEGTKEDLYIGRVEVHGNDYFYIDSRYEVCKLIYMKSMEGVYKQHISMAIWLVLIDILLASVVGILLYISMRRIYKPVSNISHELRTPLTSILGYAQYLSMDNMTDVDKKMAGRRIEAEAKYMKDVVERLLTVESLRGNSIKKEEILFDELVAEFNDRYKKMSFENHIHVINGEESLVRILLANLIENAAREDAEARFLAEGNTIRITNRAPALTKADVNNMNSGKRLGDDKIKGHGIGIELCMEIAKSHDWRIGYDLTDGVLNTIVVIK